MSKHMSIGTDLILVPTPPEDFLGFISPGPSATQADLGAAIAEAKRRALPLWDITSIRLGCRIGLHRAATAADALDLMMQGDDEIDRKDLVATQIA